jgi:hypothetical protein
MASELEVGKVGVGVAPSALADFKASSANGATIKLINSDYNNTNEFTAGIGNLDIFANTTTVLGAAYRYLRLGVGTTESIRIDSTGLTTAKDLLVADGSNDVAVALGNSGYGMALDYSSGDLSFKTNTVNRLTVSNTGLCSFSGGIAFSAPDPASAGTPASSSVLDVYEEGTWTPTYAPSSGSYTSLTMSVTSAKYTRVGDVCYVQAYIETDGTVNTSGGSGNLQISGLPFTSATGYGASFAVGYAANWGSNDVPLGGYVETGLAKITLSARSSVNGQQVSINFNNLDTGTDKNRLLFSGSYKVA